MPIADYFGGRGREVMNKMKEKYGDEEGERIFYATAKKQGQEPKSETVMEAGYPRYKESPLNDPDREADIRALEKKYGSGHTLKVVKSAMPKVKRDVARIGKAPALQPFSPASRDGRTFMEQGYVPVYKIGRDFVVYDAIQNFYGEWDTMDDRIQHSNRTLLGLLKLLRESTDEAMIESKKSVLLKRVLQGAALGGAAGGGVGLAVGGGLGAKEYYAGIKSMGELFRKMKTLEAEGFNIDYYRVTDKHTGKVVEFDNAKDAEKAFRQVMRKKGVRGAAIYGLMGVPIGAVLGAGAGALYHYRKQKNEGILGNVIRTQKVAAKRLLPKRRRKRKNEAMIDNLRHMRQKRYIVYHNPTNNMIDVWRDRYPFKTDKHGTDPDTGRKTNVVRTVIMGKGDAAGEKIVDRAHQLYRVIRQAERSGPAKRGKTVVVDTPGKMKKFQQRLSKVNFKTPKTDAEVMRAIDYNIKKWERLGQTTEWVQTSGGLMKVETTTTANIAVTPIGMKTQPSMSKKQAGFIKAANSKFCKDCEYYTGMGTCNKVAGYVQPHSSCYYFEPAGKTEWVNTSGGLMEKRGGYLRTMARGAIAGGTLGTAGSLGMSAAKRRTDWKDRALATGVGSAIIGAGMGALVHKAEKEAEKELARKRAIMRRRQARREDLEEKKASKSLKKSLVYGAKVGAVGGGLGGVIAGHQAAMRQELQRQRLNKTIDHVRQAFGKAPSTDAHIPKSSGLKQMAIGTAAGAALGTGLGMGMSYMDHRRELKLRREKARKRRKKKNENLLEKKKRQQYQPDFFDPARGGGARGVTARLGGAAAIGATAGAGIVGVHRAREIHRGAKLWNLPSKEVLKKERELFGRKYAARKYAAGAAFGAVAGMAPQAAAEISHAYKRYKKKKKKNENLIEKRKTRRPVDPREPSVLKHMAVGGMIGAAGGGIPAGAKGYRTHKAMTASMRSAGYPEKDIKKKFIPGGLGTVGGIAGAGVGSLAGMGVGAGVGAVRKLHYRYKKKKKNEEYGIIHKGTDNDTIPGQMPGY